MVLFLATERSIRLVQGLGGGVKDCLDPFSIGLEIVCVIVFSCVRAVFVAEAEELGNEGAGLLGGLPVNCGVLVELPDGVDGGAVGTDGGLFDAILDGVVVGQVARLSEEVQSCLGDIGIDG